MSCTSPVQAMRLFTGEIVFHDRLDGHALSLPCGQCMDCKLERSRQWATRCVHESSLHVNNCSILLTYDDVHLPFGNSLQYLDFQLFMKRLRKQFNCFDVSLGMYVPRFFMCGEYGETNPITKCKDGGLYRPHYHALLFGLDFPDRKLDRSLDSGSKSYKSSMLSKLWPLGNAYVADMSFEIAAYIARYCCKKITGDLAKSHYEIVLDDGEIFDRVPEFIRMSLRPGIGAKWFSKFHKDVFPFDHVISRGVEAKPPRYYDKLYSVMDPDGFEWIQYSRAQEALAQMHDNTPERREVKALVTKARASQSHRR